MNPRIYEKELTFSKEYFLTESRDGFLVPALMKHFWAAQLEVLRDISLVCEKYGIPWYADYGTMIGMVRHGGYIPWDDDLDICMMRPDYNRFLEVAPRELPDYYQVLHMDLNKEYTDPMLRITNGRTIPFDKERTEKFHGFPMVAGVDIFPLDYLYPDDAKENERRKRAVALEERIKTTPNPPWQLYKDLENVYSECDGTGSTHIGMMRFWASGGHHKYPIESLKDPVWMDFETVSLPITAMYDKILTLDYGQNYIKPIQAGGLHEYPVYTMQTEELCENWGYDPYDLKPAPEEVKEASVKAEHTFLKDVPAQLSLLKKAGGLLEVQLAEGNTENAASLLTSCQTLAIKLGTLLEGNIGIGTRTVSLLEAYCEEVYGQFLHLSSGEKADASGLSAIVTELVKEWDDLIAGDMEWQKRRIALFLPYRAAYWESMKPFYEKEAADPDCDVYVIAVPFFYRDEEKEPELITDVFPEDVTLTPPDQYEFATRRTDVVYVQYPFDGREREQSIHPFFYASAIRPHVEKMVYIPPFRLSSPGAGDEKAKHNLREFAAAAAGIYADETVVNSEAIAAIYREVYEEARKQGYPIGEKTVSVMPDPLPVVLPVTDYPAEWTEKKADKKTILYYVSESILSEYGNDAIEKIRHVFSVFEKEKEHILVLWAMDPVVEAYVMDRQGPVQEAFVSLRRKLSQSVNCILVPAKLAEKAAAFCDAYYGDRGAMVNRCLLMNKPVMIENITIQTGDA